MEDVRIIISALWVATMFNNLYGDVPMIFSGDAEKMFGAGAIYSGNVVRNCTINGDSGCYGCSDPDVELSCESLGKHYRSPILDCFKSQ
jgi:hypothetical protein